MLPTPGLEGSFFIGKINILPNTFPRRFFKLVTSNVQKRFLKSTWKFEVPSLKNLERNRFLVNFLISEKIDIEKTAVHTFVHETFYKTDLVSKISSFFYNSVKTSIL